MLNIEEKKQIVKEVNADLMVTVSVAVASYRGLTVAEMSELRNAAKQHNVRLRVIRNTLARRAVVGTDFECLTPSFEGPTLLAFSEAELSTPAKVLGDFDEDHEHLQVRALSLGGQLYGPEDVKRIATLPTKEEALSQMMALMLAPVQKLAQTLQAVPARLVRTVAAVRDQKQ